MNNLLGDLHIALHLLRGAGSSGNAKEKLDRFYAGQAQNYDEFRRRLLPGREDVVRLMQLPTQACVVDMGGGTGANLDWLSKAQTEEIEQWHLVDLCHPLIEVAADRSKGKPFVQIHEADAVTWQPPQPVDAILFSYSLTMIPDWQAALNNALDMLKPGGQFHIVDFYIADQHSAFTRKFWPIWFSWDGVYLSDQHLPWLQANLRQTELHEATTRLPLIPGSQVPWYSFSGIKC